jgi:SHAQKYF class myb-like DNA-binding protein
MTITPAVQRQFFDEESKQLIYLPSRQASSPAMIESIAAMSISSVRPSVNIPDLGDSIGFDFTSPMVSPATVSHSYPSPPTTPSPVAAQSTSGSAWTEEEHARFLLGLDLFPSGPWKAIARCVGTRTARQTMSHAQKYRQKIGRRQRQRERQRQRIGLVLGAQALVNHSCNSTDSPEVDDTFSIQLQQQQDVEVMDVVMAADESSIASTATTGSGPSGSEGGELELDEQEKELMLMGAESPLLLLTDDALADFMAP